MASDANDSDRISRRRFIELTGVSGAAALAGCSGDGGGATATPTETSDSGTPEPGPDTTTDTPTDTPGMQVVDAAFKNSGQDDPTATHFNQLANQNYSWNAAWNIHDRYAAWNFADREFKMAALESWSIDGKTVTLKIRDDLTWDNGKDVTTRDMKTQWELLKKAGSTVWDFAESISVVDDKTMEVTLKQESHPEIIKFSIAALRMGFPHSVYKQFLDKKASAIQQFKWNENVIGNGPFSLETQNAQEFRFSRNPDYYRSENVNFSTMRVVYRDSNTAIQQGLASGELDGSTSLFVPAGTVKTFPDEIVEVNIPAKWGYGMVFNHDDPIFGDRAVRQATAHVVNRKQIVENGGPRTKFPADTPCGIPPKSEEPWLGDMQSKFETYGVDKSQTDKAAQILRDAGYTKKNGTWQNADGKKIKAQYYSPAGWTDWTTMTNTVVDQLNSFGFDLTVSTIPTSDWFGNYIDSNFKVGGFYWMPGGARSSFPYFPLRHQLVNEAISGGHNFPNEKRTVPAMEGSGTMEFNPTKLVKGIATTPAGEQTKQKVRKAAWHNNHDLPMLSLVSKFEQSWLTDDDQWDVVPESDSRRQVKWPPHWLPRTGGLTANQS